MHFEESMEHVVQAFEIAGVAILAIGSIVAMLGAARTLLSGKRAEAYERARRDIGRSILLGLEVLIIADIVQTITIDPTLESAAVLAIIVLVRTFLSFSLEVELDGVVPWRKRRMSDTTTSSERRAGKTARRRVRGSSIVTGVAETRVVAIGSSPVTTIRPAGCSAADEVPTSSSISPGSTT